MAKATKAKYVDGFVLPVPKKNLKAYKKMAASGANAWMKFGALDYVEAVGDDLNIKFGMPFPKFVKPKKGETIVFAYITYKSRKHRDQVNKKVMAYFDKKYGNKKTPMPFDMKRMGYGGFKTLVSG